MLPTTDAFEMPAVRPQKPALLPYGTSMAVKQLRASSSAHQS